MPTKELNPKALLREAKLTREQFVEDLRALVGIESPSDDRDAVNRAVDWVEEQAKSLGATTQRYPQERFGDHLEVRFGSANGKPPVLMLGHVDTVWPLGTLASMPFKIHKKRAYGPGVLDMKVGIVMALDAVRLLQEAGFMDREVSMLLVSDEEVGSDSSRAITEKLAQQHKAVFVLEPGQGLYGAAKTWRKGVGHYNVRVQGVAAHAGVDFKAGQSAITELAEQILKINSFVDLRRGVTVNPGVISGGTRSNVVAASAMAEVDVRIQKPEDGPRIDKLMRSLKVKNKACKITVEGGINRPPMERSDKVLALYAKAKEIARDIGFDLKEEGTGGGSDGNFTAALGVPTLDGLGGVGEGAHAQHESVLLDEVPRRTALLAALIHRV
jgi:glutamate carboxypeptidase